MRIELNFPSADLFPNRAKGRHWSATYEHKTRERTEAYLLTKQAKNKAKWEWNEKQIEIHLTFEMPDKRHRDIDNCLAASKSALDGVAEALGVDDKFFNPLCIFREQREKPGKLIVEIWSYPK
jgi:crossover junction endodeoxyribonuclease RusA